MYRSSARYTFKNFKEGLNINIFNGENSRNHIVGIVNLDRNYEIENELTKLDINLINDQKIKDRIKRYQKFCKWLKEAEIGQYLCFYANVNYIFNKHNKFNIFITPNDEIKANIYNGTICEYIYNYITDYKLIKLPNNIKEKTRQNLIKNYIIAYSDSLIGTFNY